MTPAVRLASAQNAVIVATLKFDAAKKALKVAVDAMGGWDNLPEDETVVSAALDPLCKAEYTALKEKFEAEKALIVVVRDVMNGKHRLPREVADLLEQGAAGKLMRGYEGSPHDKLIALSLRLTLS